MGNLGKTYPRLGPKIDVRRECRNCVFFLEKVASNQSRSNRKNCTHTKEFNDCN